MSNYSRKIKVQILVPLFGVVEFMVMCITFVWRWFVHITKFALEVPSFVLLFKSIAFTFKFFSGSRRFG